MLVLQLSEFGRHLLDGPTTHVVVHVETWTCMSMAVVPIIAHPVVVGVGRLQFLSVLMEDSYLGVMI